MLRARGLTAESQTTDVAVAALAEARVIQPWPIKLKAEQSERSITGLYCIDEVALNALADDVFLKLRKTSGALPIAYAQMLSMGQLGIFQHLARLQAQLRPPPASAPCPKASIASSRCRAAIQSSFGELMAGSGRNCACSRARCWKMPSWPIDNICA